MREAPDQGGGDLNLLGIGNVAFQKDPSLSQFDRGFGIEAVCGWK